MVMTGFGTYFSTDIQRKWRHSRNIEFDSGFRLSIRPDDNRLAGGGMLKIQCFSRAIAARYAGKFSFIYNRSSKDLPEEIPGKDQT